MIYKRTIPCLLLNDDKLVHIKNFDKTTMRYVGDPINTINIYNDYQIDEMIIVDISSSNKNHKINFKLLCDLAGEAFFPLAYGGGINNAEDAAKIIKTGFEKIIINSEFFRRRDIISDCAKIIGSQSIILSIDLYFNSNKYYVFDHITRRPLNIEIGNLFSEINNLGIGELMLTCVNRDGNMSGYDEKLIKLFKKKINMPFIYKGGLSSYSDIKNIFNLGVDGVASSTLFIMKKKDGGIVINYPPINLKDPTC